MEFQQNIFFDQTVKVHGVFNDLLIVTELLFTRKIVINSFATRWTVAHQATLSTGKNTTVGSFSFSILLYS